MLDEKPTDSQRWTLADGFLQSAMLSDGIVPRHLVLDVIWSDVPLVTNGAELCAWHKDDSASQQWMMMMTDDK